MTMRIFLDPKKALAHSAFLKAPSPPPNEDIRPEHWGHCFLNGLRLHWDSEVGMPFIELRAYATHFPDAILQVLGVSDQGICDWTESIAHHVTILESWAGRQPACVLDGLSPKFFEMAGVEGRLSQSSFCAMLTRNGEHAVSLELFLRPANIFTAQSVYLAIRQWPQDRVHSFFSSRALCDGNKWA